MAKQKSFLNAVKWSYTATWGERAFSALFTFILAALLGPRDFGILSIAIVYVTFLQMFIDQGLATALVQRKNLEAGHLNAVFWATQALSFLLVGLSVLLSRWWAAVNHAPQVAAIIPVLSLCIPIEGLALIQKTLLSKEMDYKSLSLRSNASVLVGGVIGIGMAYGGLGVWALVGQQIIRDLTALILLWRLSPWRPRLEFSWKYLRDLMSFSVPQFVAQLANFVDTQTGSILLGLFFGPLAVGLYRLAERLTNTVIYTATSSIQSVSLPEFSRLQDDPAQLRKSLLTCIRLSSTVTLPALAGLAAASGSLMAVLGPKWVPAADVLKVLCVLGMFLIFAFFTGPLLQALGKVRLVAILEWFRTAVGLALLVTAGFIVRNGSLNTQIIGLAVARFVLGAVLVTPVFLYLLMRFANLRFSAFISSIVPSVLSAFTVVAAMLIVQSLSWFSNARPTLLLAAEGLVGGVLGLLALLLFDIQLRTTIARLAKRTLGLEAFDKTAGGTTFKSGELTKEFQ